MKILITKCPNCGQEIYSRAQHDYKSCECGDISVDGGEYDYEDDTWKPFRVAMKDIKRLSQRIVKVSVEADELYADWNNSEDEYGVYTE